MHISSPPRSSITIAPVPTWRQWMRRLYLLAAGLVEVAVVVQVFFAGAAALVDPACWGVHRALATRLRASCSSCC